ncbi:MAG: protein phosphatase 2C domain-containing protein [Fimbriimonadaceae bacterium]|nr:protein phosphatase 2C domain-containing protein [Fimbriimonadaceae bacterium]
MSAFRGRGRRRRSELGANEDQKRRDAGNPPEFRETADLAVDIFPVDAKSKSDHETAPNTPLPTQESLTALIVPPPAEESAGENYVEGVPVSADEWPQSKPDDLAPSDLGQPTFAPPVAEVVGPVRVPQLVIGTASPDVEPKLTGDEFRSFPFRPDTVVDGWSSARVTVRGASLRGHFHRYNGAPRQDDFAVHQLTDGRVIALVADGVSQSPQSHVGATAAVRAAARWLDLNLSLRTEETDWLTMVKEVAWALAEQARVTFSLDSPDPKMALQFLSTTLLCAVIEPSAAETVKASLVCVGDSGAWLLRDGQFTQVLGGKAVGEGGISSSAVVGLPQVPPQLDAVTTDFRAGDVLMLGTDGFGDPLGNGSGGVGNLFRELFNQPEPPSLIEFAHALDFSRETFDDDRTLIAIAPRGHKGPAG